ncbi:AzlD domain-containing protein [Roseomonas sp. OT10]|uniref:AzlD family protein n=1 Tax=Roseomonas cutis TaxID=2897332 RepID=UPI001E30F6A1|nr:AzlD domain-containing protein [Roseomonas sp. OT10]UFN47013.1 AzlD domain-containing protein [Roseomonas sp. OT10]
MSLHADALAGILVMAALTYLCRAGGYVLRRSFRLPPFAEALLRELPGPLFVAYAAPALLAHGWVGLVGAVAVVLAQWRFRQFGLSIVIGVAAVWAAQLLGR